MFEYDVVVAGGGFAGVNCVRSLLKRNRHLRVALLSDDNYLVFQPMLAEVSGASISPRHVVNPLRAMCRGAYVLKGEINRIDWPGRSLTLDAGDFTANIKVRFKQLVLAVGAKVDLSRVPGMPEHALLLQNVGDAMKLRATVISRFEEANLVEDPSLRRRLLTFTIVGGGYSGVEVAGALIDLFEQMYPRYSYIEREDFRVVLVHAGEHLMPTLSKPLGEYAARNLLKRRLDLRLGRRVAAVTASKLILDDHSEVQSHTCISTVGNAPHTLVSALLNEQGWENVNGRIPVSPTLQSYADPDLFACGDCAAVPHPKGGYCPATAQFAQRQGQLLGENIHRARQGQSLKPFTFKGLGEFAAIGHRNAVGDVLGLRFSGFLAWWMWRTIYLAKLPGIERKLRVAIDWTFDLFFPRDINLLNPRYTTLVKKVYLEPGDILFQAGDPAFSFYVVREGAIELLDENSGSVVKTIPEGEFFGERALLRDGRWMYTARAKQGTYLVALGAEAFRALSDSSSILRQLFEASASDLEATAPSRPS